MLTPVIMTAEQVFQEAGYTTLAFNFRGVGGSAGAYGEGQAEVADVTGALTHLEAVLGGSVEAVRRGGYSFGSFVGAMAAAADRRVLSTWASRLRSAITTSVSSAKPSAAWR